MAVPDPDTLYFQFFGGGGSDRIELEQEVRATDWEDVTSNDIYLWSYANRRTFYNFGDFNSTLQTAQAIPADVIIAEGFFNLADGRKDILMHHDLAAGTLTVRLWTNGGVNFLTNTVTEVARAQGTSTFAAVATTATDGYFTVELRNTTPITVCDLYGLKLIEQRIALADL